MEQPEAKDWIELAKIHQSSYQDRRALEWRLAFGFWTAIGAFTAAFFTLDTETMLPDWFDTTLKQIYFVLLAASIVFWQIPIHTAHGGDRKLLHHAVNMAKGVVEPIPETATGIQFWKNWNGYDVLWFFGQSIFTATFLYLSWLAITKIAT